MRDVDRRLGGSPESNTSPAFDELPQATSRQLIWKPPRKARLRTYHRQSRS